MKILILAGGSGTRLWPLSRENNPKQFIKLHNSKLSLFQETINRSLLLSELENIFIITSQRYKEHVIKDIKELGYYLDDKNILVEPEAKNTLPAILAGVRKMGNTNDTVIVLPSDHKITNPEKFAQIIKESEELANEYLITFGIEAKFPNTNYGYILPSNPIKNGFKVDEFKEKPDYDTAIEYIKNGYYWNSGIFMFKKDILISEINEYVPEILRVFEATDNIKDAYENITGALCVSFDIAVMEKSNKSVVVPAKDIGWNDMGNFDSFYDVFEKDENMNILSNDSTIMLDSMNNIVYTDQLDKVIVTVGINDLIIIDNQDALLICKKSRSQDVKQVVELLPKSKM